MNTNAAPQDTDDRATSIRESAYWSQNLRTLAVLLVIWFIGSFGTSILLIDELDKIEFFGFHLGFWFAQQGSIYIFLALIIAYVWKMNALDAEFEQADDPKTEQASAEKNT